MNHISEIIIIGPNHHNTLSMVRSFGEEGQNVTLFIYGASSSYIASSIYVENASFFVTAIDAIESIFTRKIESHRKPLIIACSDEVSSLMDLLYNELIPRCYFFNAGMPGRVTSYMDKQKQLELAKDCGFSVPMSIDILPKDIPFESMTFPCIIKPKASIYGGKNISICHTKDEMEVALKKYNPRYNVLIQDFIRKEGEIVILGISVRESIIIPGFVQKHREENGGTTYSSIKPISECNPQIIESCKDLINQIGYQGLWGIECIMRGDEYFFIELNMRNDATTYAMKVAGVNLPYMYKKLIELPDKEFAIEQVRTIKSIVEFNDFNFVLKGKVCLFKWIREYINAECKYFHSDKDPKPYLLHKKEYYKFLKKRILNL